MYNVVPTASQLSHGIQTDRVAEERSRRLGRASEQRLAARGAASAQPTEDLLRARAGMRNVLAQKQIRRGVMGAFNQTSPMPSEDEEEQEHIRVIRLPSGKSTAVVLPPPRPPERIGAALPPTLKRERQDPASSGGSDDGSSSSDSEPHERRERDQANAKREKKRRKERKRDKRKKKAKQGKRHKKEKKRRRDSNGAV
uniref:Uncharacterized protein n=1 Tax=Haptolina ericina TaxID=156174 RepID=A0A7S3BVW8_9EUKA|mmetsp:Transcript_68741/g.153368  ORF Transcript_68741/g.153368 Transcript_68741/m.153368 type:complete len:198 (+) Transcript_68741:89-682(+)